MEKIRIGIFGGGRGVYLARNLMLLDAEIVALCEGNEQRRKQAAEQLGKGVTAYEKFEDFIEHPMDAVVLTNNFFQHAPYAIKCFEKNLHVLSECISNGTMGEGVELVRAFEKSKSIYMLAENYPHMLHCREMRRIAAGGTLGKIVFAEGEYNHTVDTNNGNFIREVHPYLKHWRHYCPRTYYVTHSLGPLMNITGATPKKVTAFAMFAPPEEDIPRASYNGDVAANITTFNDDGSVYRFTGCSTFGSTHIAYRVCGTKGQIENLRGIEGQVMLRYDEWQTPKGELSQKLYKPSWNDQDEDLIVTSGHGGGDYITCRIFMECLKEEKQPSHPFDIYSATAMSSVAILGHRSVLEGGKVYDIPDFRKEEDRKLYENDYLTPFWGTDGSAPTIPCCSHPDYKPTEKQLELYKEKLGDDYEVWKNGSL